MTYSVTYFDIFYELTESNSFIIFSIPCGQCTQSTGEFSLTLLYLFLSALSTGYILRSILKLM